MKTIALYDNCRDGHHFTYLRLFSQTLLEMDYRVVVFCQTPDEITEWIISQCPKQAENLYTFKVEETGVKLPIIGKLPRTINVLAEWHDAATSISKASLEIGFSPDLVFFAWLDNYLSDYLTHHIIDSIFPYPWSGLYFHPYYLRSGYKTLPILRFPLSPYAVTQSSRCRSLALFDEMETSELKYKLDKPIIVFPDVTDESSPDLSCVIAKQIREKAGDRKIVGLLGGLTRRKGLLTLLEVAQQAVLEDWFFVFVGQLYDHELLPEELTKIWSFVRSEPEHCFFYFDRIADEAQFNSVITECDVLFAAYENFPYSSNILTKAAVFEKLVIVSDGFCMSERVKRFQIGVSIPENSVLDCIAALQTLFTYLTSTSQMLKPNFEIYRNLHSIEQLRNALKEVCTT
jgi:glycosyltransferase involved in cell wall biosynthesis